MSTIDPPTPEPGDAPVGDPSDPSPEPAARRSSWRSWVIAGVASLLVGAVAVYVLNSGKSSSASVAANQGASSQSDSGGPNGFGRGGTRGSVTKIDGGDLTVQVTDRSGSTSTVVVHTSSSTTVTESVAGALSDLKQGDNIVVAGDNSTGAITARTITDSSDMAVFGGRGNGTGGRNRNGGQGFPPPADSSGAPTNPNPNGVFTAGTIASIDGSTITISTPNGNSTTVTTTSSTTVMTVKSGSVSDIKVGDTVLATGDNSNGVVNATTIRVGDFGFGGFGGGGFRGRQGNGSNSSSSQSGA